MKKISLAFVFDYLFSTLIAFLISFVWLRFLHLRAGLSFVLSIIISILITLIFNFNNQLKKNNKIEQLNTNNDIEQYLYTLMSNTKKENLDYFYNTIKKIKSNPRVIEDSAIEYFDNTIKKQVILLPLFDKKMPRFEDLLKEVKKFSNKKNIKITILCNQIDLRDKIFFENLKDYKISILTKEQVYLQFIKSSEIYPSIIFEPNKKRHIQFKELLFISFNKENTKKYFFSGLIIFLCSFFVRFNIYYVFMSSLLFLFALICKKKQYQACKKNDL